MRWEVQYADPTHLQGHRQGTLGTGTLGDPRHVPAGVSAL